MEEENEKNKYKILILIKLFRKKCLPHMEKEELFIILCIIRQITCHHLHVNENWKKHL